MNREAGQSGSAAVKEDLSSRQITWISVSMLLVVAPHSMHLPLWVSLCFLILIVWRLMGAFNGWPLPDREHSTLTLLKQALAIGAFAGVYISNGGHLGRDAGISLLIILLGLKILETRPLRDFYVVSSIGYFLVITNFFYSQSIPTALYMLAVVICITASLISVNDRAERMAPGQKIRLASVMLAQALPITILAFVFFPRIPGPLWGMPADAYKGMTGLSEELTPGNISQLSQSDETAFRVKFRGKMPPLSQLYWRGPVLWNTDGRTWTAGASKDSLPVPVYTFGESYDYAVTLEPHNKKWLFVLEMPSLTPRIGHITRDFQLLSSRPVRQRLRYSARSWPDYRVTDNTREELNEALALPPGLHPRAVDLADRWRQQFQDSRELVRHALSFFHDEQFYYTLTPPLLGGDTIDGFLFGSRRGFCEHYAAAFAVLMRAAGIPTRIVTGYQGGEYNSIGDYLIVRQRDAHAWTEIWLDERGWTRVDPTAAVSPDRIEQGVDQVLPERLSLMPLGLVGNDALLQFWHRLRNTVDAVNNRWNQWILGYDRSRQNELLSRLGFRNLDWRGLSLWLATSSASLLLMLAWWVLVKRPAAMDPVRALYDRFCAKLASSGINRSPCEGPLDFARRAQESRSDLASAIDRITRLYIECRYGPDQGDPIALKTEVKKFRP